VTMALRCRLRLSGFRLAPRADPIRQPPKRPRVQNRLGRTERFRCLRAPNDRRDPVVRLDLARAGRRGRDGFRGGAEPPPSSIDAVAIRHSGEGRTAFACWRRNTRHCARRFRREAFPSRRSRIWCAGQGEPRLRFPHRRTNPCSHRNRSTSPSCQRTCSAAVSQPPGAAFREGRRRKAKSPGHRSRNPGFLKLLRGLA
jgi:hypothetical protein